MTYVLEPHDKNSFVIRNENSNCRAGHVDLKDGRWHVTCGKGGDDIGITIVKSLDDAIPAFAAYYERHPPKWKRSDDWIGTGPSARKMKCYIKETDFASLFVGLGPFGRWVAYRDSDDFPLLRHGKIASFITHEDAKRIADLHERDGYPNCVTMDDGFTWPVDPDIEKWFTWRGEWPAGKKH